MSIRTYFEEIITGKRRGIDALCLRLIASCCSLMYILGVRLRLLLYHWGLFRTHSLEARVISIGNITLGGAGKTPVVAYIADRFQEGGRRIGILSRGYGRAGTGLKIVSVDHEGGPDWRHIGDEPYLLSRRCSGVPIVVGTNRVQAGREAMATFGTDTLLLDDGYQHMKLCRDIDIVVIDASQPFGNHRVFPAGPLREPINNLRRADLFWLTRVDQADDLPSLKQFLKTVKADTMIVESVHHPLGLRCHHSGSEIDMSALREARIILLSGIANPRSFEKTAADLGAQGLQHFTFPDHHPFTHKDIETVQKAASQGKASFILTTEKDGVRIPRDSDYDVPIYELLIEIHITRGQEDLEKILWNKMNTHNCRMRN